MKELNDKISQLKDEHAAEIVDQQGEEFNERARTEAIFMLGRIKQNEHLAVAISTNLTAQTIRALEHFQETKGFVSLGYTTFVDFLEKSEFAPMSKRQYYERRELMNNHGDEIYDLLTSVGISVRAQKLLGKGDLAIKGDRLVVGGQEIEVANTGVIKEVLEELFDERRELEKQVQKRDDKIDQLDQQIDVGRREIEQLERNIDSLKSRNPQERALGDAITAVLEVSRVVGQMTDDNAKAKFGENALPVLWKAIQQVKQSCGTAFVFEGDTKPSGSDLDDIAAEALGSDEMDED